jgi:hypothetical protein
VIGDDLQALEGRHRREPPLQPFVDASGEVRQALVEVGFVARPERSELAGEIARHDRAILRIEPVMRVAARVDVAHRARDLALRDVEDAHVHRRVDVAVRPDLDLRVATLLYERRQPADLALLPKLSRPPDRSAAGSAAGGACAAAVAADTHVASTITDPTSHETRIQPSIGARQLGAAVRSPRIRLSTRP